MVPRHIKAHPALGHTAQEWQMLGWPHALEVNVGPPPFPGHRTKLICQKTDHVVSWSTLLPFTLVETSFIDQNVGVPKIRPSPFLHRMQSPV